MHPQVGMLPVSTIPILRLTFQAETVVLPPVWTAPWYGQLHRWETNMLITARKTIRSFNGHTTAAPGGVGGATGEGVDGGDDSHVTMVMAILII